MKCLLFLSLCVSLMACKKKSDPPVTPDIYDVKFTVKSENLAMVNIARESDTTIIRYFERGHKDWDTTMQIKKGKGARLDAWPFNKQNVYCSIDYTPGNGHAEKQDTAATLSRPVEVQITLPK